MRSFGDVDEIQTSSKGTSINIEAINRNFTCRSPFDRGETSIPRSSLRRIVVHANRVPGTGRRSVPGFAGPVLFLLCFEVVDGLELEFSGRTPNSYTSQFRVGSNFSFPELQPVSNRVLMTCERRRSASAPAVSPKRSWCGICDQCPGFRP
jgi:hypothetical protein